MNINDVPPWINRSDIAAMVKTLGFDPQTLKRLKIDPGAVTAVVTALGPNGEPFSAPGVNKLATHTITIPVADL